MSFTPPDWRNESQYPTHETEANLAFWAWQFLRRNRDYQADWSKYITDLQRVVEHEPRWLPYLQRRDPLAEIFRDCVAPSVSEDWKWPHLGMPSMPLEFVEVDPQALPDERTVGEWRSRLRETQVGKYSVRPRDIELGKKWGLRCIQDPGAATLQRFNSFLTDGRVYTMVGDRNTRIDDENFWVPEIDLRYPVEVLRAQFEVMLAEREQRVRKGTVVPYQGRPQRALPNYQSYLRVLDATDSGVGIPEIADSILPHQDFEGAKKVVRNWCIAAEKIRAETYMTLPAYQQIAFEKG